MKAEDVVAVAAFQVATDSKATRLLSEQDYFLNSEEGQWMVEFLWRYQWSNIEILGRIVHVFFPAFGPKSTIPFN